MNYEIKDNFLDQKEINYFRETILSNNFPWFLTGVQSNEDPLHKQFVHIFYKEDNFNTDYKELLYPILNKLNPTAIHRIKANLLTKTHNIIEPPFHTDHTSKNVLSSILYINTNNGYTGFKDQKSLSIKNRLITFPSCTPHYGSTCSDEHFRIVVNMVYIK